MPAPVDARLERLGLRSKPKKAPRQETHVLEEVPTLKPKSKKSTKKVKK